jgi:hypothetical protein
MARIRYRTDAIILSSQPSNWKEQLHLAIHRRQQRGWQLVAFFPEGAELAEGQDSLMNRPSAAVTCLFSCNTHRNHGLRRSNGRERMSTTQQCEKSRARGEDLTAAG